jgi:uncharacterized lipoprotein YddW (UPF0748 family)
MMNATNIVLVYCFPFFLSAEVAETNPPALTDSTSSANALPYQADLWQPMQGSPKVETIHDGRALRMKCPFKAADDQLERASWDLIFKRGEPGKQISLALAQGIQFKIFCRDRSPIGSFTLYLQSGKGWYSYRFAPDSDSEWSTVRVLKENTKIEGTPAGWSHIDAIRLSAWRAENRDTEIFVADIEKLSIPSEILLVRAESVFGRAPTVQNSVLVYFERMSSVLRSLNIPFNIISDRELGPEILQPGRIVILPHNPAILPETVKQLSEFLDNGGKLLSFYSVAEPIRRSAGMAPGYWVGQERPGHFSTIQLKDGFLSGAPRRVQQSSWNLHVAKPIAGKSSVAAEWLDGQGKSTGQPAILVSANSVHMTHVLLPDDIERKKLLVLAMLGHLKPDLWKIAAEKSVERFGHMGHFKNLSETIDEIRKALSDRRGLAVLTGALYLRKRAEGEIGQSKFAEAMETMRQAESKLTEAYCRAHSSEKGEHRAFWCHRASGPAGLTWDETIRLLAVNGFTAVLPNMLWGGTAYYESDVLPVAPSVKKSGDYLAECLKACRKYGIECHVWKVNWNMSGHAPREFVEKIRKEARHQVDKDGKPYETWLCPSHPKNQQLEIDSMLEVLKKYDVDGLHFDYIRYPGKNHCFCNGCRERFEKILGKAVKDWPADTEQNPEAKRAWQAFRQSNITKVVESVSREAKRIKKSVEISAAVFRNWQVDRFQVAQDWKLWCDKGYLDFVCPMDYTPNTAQFANYIKTQQKLVGNVPCYPGIGLSLWNPSTALWTFIEQIKMTRKFKTGGFTVFDLQSREAKELVPLCGLGITKKE